MFPRRHRVRIHPYLDAPAARKLAIFVAASGATESAVVQEAVLKHVDRTSQTTLLLKELDKLGRANARAHRDLEFLMEAFAVWVKLWFAHTASIADDGKDHARRTAEVRYSQFIKKVAQQFADGRYFLDELSDRVREQDDEATPADADKGSIADRAKDPAGTRDE
jgi:hypothetical protein